MLNYEVIALQPLPTSACYFFAELQGGVVSCKWIPNFEELSLRELDVLFRLNSPYLLKGSALLTSYNSSTNGCIVVLPICEAGITSLNDNWKVCYQVIQGLSELHRNAYTHQQLELACLYTLEERVILGNFESVKYSHDPVDFQADLTSLAQLLEEILLEEEVPPCFQQLIQGLRDGQVSLDELLQASVFSSYRQYTCAIEAPGIPIAYAPDHRNNLKILIQWFRDLLSTSSCETLFLAIDLFNRLDGYLASEDALLRLDLLVVVLTMSLELVENRRLEFTEEVLRNIRSLYPEFNTFNLKLLYRCLSLLRGVLNLNELYQAIQNRYQLGTTFTHIIMHKTQPELYIQLDIQTWIRGLRDGDSKEESKQISVGEMFA